MGRKGMKERIIDGKMEKRKNDCEGGDELDVTING